MKDTVYIVQLNDFEVDIAIQMEPDIRKLGKGYRWKHDLVRGHEIKFRVEEVTKDKVILTGQFGVPKFRLKIAGDDVSFSTVNAMAPEAIFYDLIHLLMGQHNPSFIAKLMVPHTYDMVSTDPNDYFIMNNSYTSRISKYFSQIPTDEKELAYRSGMFHLELATFTVGKEKLRAFVKEFAEKSCYDEVVINFVYHRGHGIPLFYGNGAVFCPIAEKDYFDAVQEDFTRIFMKFTNPSKETYNMSLKELKKDGGFDEDRPREPGQDSR